MVALVLPDAGAFGEGKLVMLYVTGALFAVKGGTALPVRAGPLADICATLLLWKNKFNAKAGQSPLFWKNIVKRLVPSRSARLIGACAQVGPFIKELVNPSGFPPGTPSVKNTL